SGFAMAYWGEALSYNQPLWLNENLDKARATLGRLAPSRAARQAKAPTAREKGYLDAVERLFGDGDKRARDRAYAGRMAQLHAARALAAAKTYARIAPASSHARHMPSHVFLPLGMWDEAVASDEAAFATSVEIAKRKNLPPSQYDFHALSWLHYEYLQQGRFAKAREAMGE